VNRAPGRRNHWKRVERARTHIEGNATKIAKALVKRALEGDAKTAKWLLEHTAATDVEGNELRPIAVSVDSRSGNSLPPADTAPRIMIGFSLGSDFARLNVQPAESHVSQADRPQLPSAVLSHPVAPGE